MKIAFYVGKEFRTTPGSHFLLSSVALVTGYLDEQLGHLELKLHLKQGDITSALTASAATLAVNQAFEACPEVAVRSMSIKCDNEVPEWA